MEGRNVDGEGAGSRERLGVVSKEGAPWVKGLTD